MIRAVVLVLVLAGVAVAGVLMTGGNLDDVRARITGDSTPIPTSTATPVQLPTATPTPSLPANPQALHRWDNLPVHYCVDVASSGFVPDAAFTQLVEQAFVAWGVPTVDDGACYQNMQDDNVNEIGWGTPPGAPPPGSNVTEAGVTLTSYRECRAACDDDPVRVVEADIIIEQAPPRRFRTRDCLYSTLLHETGHFLGLAHLPSPAVMAAESSGCLTRLSQADIDALLARYGDRAHPGG